MQIVQVCADRTRISLNFHLLQELAAALVGCVSKNNRYEVGQSMIRPGRQMVVSVGESPCLAEVDLEGLAIDIDKGTGANILFDLRTQLPSRFNMLRFTIELNLDLLGRHYDGYGNGRQEQHHHGGHQIRVRDPERSFRLGRNPLGRHEPRWHACQSLALSAYSANSSSALLNMLTASPSCF